LCARFVDFPLASDELILVAFDEAIYDGLDVLSLRKMFAASSMEIRF